MEIKSEKIVTSYDARKTLKEREKASELNYEQKNALDYLNRFCSLPEAKVKTLLEKLSKIEKLQDKHVVAIAEMLPQDDEDLRLLFANERTVLEDAEKKQILEAVKEASK
ncbi:MAG: DNA-directed RNA polymerase subunit F [Candidatus Aenigmatarchaeota archaeon]